MKEDIIFKKPIKSILMLFILSVFILLFSNEVLAHNEPPSSALRSASEYDYPPMCITTEDGKADGFSVELLKEVLNAVNTQVEFKVGAWSDIKDELKNGQIDVLPLVGRTPEREDIFDFTFPYLSLHGAIFVRSNYTGIRTIGDLRDKKVLVMKGDNAEEFVRRENISNNIITTDTYEEAFKLLSSGENDAIISQEVMGLQLLKKLKINNIVKVNYDLDSFNQDFSFAVKEGDKHLLEELNEGLSIVVANGKYNELYKKWFGPVIEAPVSIKKLVEYTTISIVALLFIVVVISIYFLKKEVKRRTHDLIKEIEERKLAEKELAHGKRILKELNEELKVAKLSLEEKNKELEETLEDFYTMRLGMSRDLKLGQVEKENKKIKNKLNKLKKQKTKQ